MLVPSSEFRAGLVTATADRVVKLPLPAHARALAKRRYHVYVMGPKYERVVDGEKIVGRKVIAEGRFVHCAYAQAWADHAHADAELVDIEYLGAHDGWERHPVARRTGGGWQMGRA